jgi:hypothetical protein
VLLCPFPLLSYYSDEYSFWISGLGALSLSLYYCPDFPAISKAAEIKQRKINCNRQKISPTLIRLKRRDLSHSIEKNKEDEHFCFHVKSATLSEEIFVSS